MKQVSKEHIDTMIVTLARFICGDGEPLPCHHCMKHASDMVFKIAEERDITMITEASQSLDSMMDDLMKRAGIDMEALAAALVPMGRPRRLRPDPVPPVVPVPRGRRLNKPR